MTYEQMKKILSSKIKPDSYIKSIGAKVIKIYDNFTLVERKGYKECILNIDMLQMLEGVMPIAE